MTNPTALERASAVDMLDAFRLELLAHRHQIENCTADNRPVPVFDVVVALVEQVIAEVESLVTA